MTHAVLHTLRGLASTRLTLAGFASLAAAVLWHAGSAQGADGALAAATALLGLNLAAALALRPRLRRGALGLFHLALLGCLGLLAWGRMTHVEGHVEVVQDGVFDASALTVTSQGPWSGDALRGLHFEQGPFEVHYAPRLKRLRTDSRVAAVRDGVRVESTVGDDRALVVDGTRFTTTHNKGFAPLLAWTPAGAAAPVRGAVHLPAYPLYDWQQKRDWAPPGGPRVALELKLPQPPDEAAEWVLRPDHAGATLRVTLEGRSWDLAPGESARGDFGELRYERLLGWMGYRVHHDPSLAVLWWTACAGAAALAWHLVAPPVRRRPRPMAVALEAAR